MRVDYGATQYVGAYEDPRCPDWKSVLWRRTYNTRNGKIIVLDHIIHSAISDTSVNTDIATTVMND